MNARWITYFSQHCFWSDVSAWFHLQFHVQNMFTFYILEVLSLVREYQQVTLTHFKEKRVNKFVKPLSASDKNVSGPELRTELQTFTKNHHKSRRHARQLLVWELSQWSKRVMLLKCQIVVTLLVRGFLDNFHYHKKTYHNSEAIAPSGAKSKTIERQ